MYIFVVFTQEKHMWTIVLTLDGNSDIGAFERSNVCYLIFASIESRHKSYFFFEKKTFLISPCAICSELASTKSTMLWTPL